MRIINEYPLNKKHFIKLKKFAKKVLLLCEEVGTIPVAWGSVVYFGYTKDSSLKITDLDLLIPKASINKIINLLEKKKMNYNLVGGWNCLQIFNNSLRIELDPIEYYGKFKKFDEMNFGDLSLKVVSKNDLIKRYKNAYHDKRVDEVGPTKKSEYKKKFELLQNSG